MIINNETNESLVVALVKPLSLPCACVCVSVLTGDLICICSHITQTDVRLLTHPCYLFAWRHAMLFPVFWLTNMNVNA